MSSIVTRLLGGVDRFDRQAIRVDAGAFASKSGIIEVTVVSYVTPVGGGYIDVRAPNYNPANDDVVVSGGAGSGTETLNKKVYIAVNNGQPGPSAQVNPDGTWDLLVMTVTLPDGNVLSSYSIALNYSVSFTDLTPSTSNPTTGNGSLTLNVSPSQPEDAAAIGILDSSIGSSNGYIKAWLNSVVSTVVDKTVPPIGILNPVGNTGDPSATLTVTGSDRNSGGCGCNGSGQRLTLVQHRLAKLAGSKTYSQAMFVFAVNTGKIDANGKPGKGTNSQSVCLKAKLELPPDSDDTVSLAVSYNVSFQAV